MAKKLSVIFSAFFILISLFFINKTPIFNKFNDQYEIYLKSYSSDSNIIYISDKEYPFLFSIKGESIIIDKENFCVISFFNQMRAKILFVEEIDGITSYYGYSPKIKYEKLINNKVVNLHVAISQELIKIGSPIIFGSF